MKNPLAHRDPELVRALLDVIYETDQPTGWTDLVDSFTSETHQWKTVENVLYDLVAVGAAHRVGAPARGRTPDTRALRPTLLGRAWLDQDPDLLPTIPERTTT